MIWIDKQEAADAAFERIAAQPIVAVDTEADSLHSYFDKVCLIQISIPGEDFVFDPLRPIDLARFGQILANPSITKVLHGADYDLRILNRDFGFVVSNLIDTVICAQLLGYEAFGLAALLERHFNQKLNKVHQRADWARRPLPKDMLEYAALDTRFLIRLAAILREELTKLGRWEWAEEEFARLSSVRHRESDEDEEGFRRLKHIGALDRRSLAIVRSLHEWRDRLARAADRPPFKIIGNDTIIEVAKARPPALPELERVKALSRYHFDRYGKEIMAMIRAALELPEGELPERGEPKQWLRDKAIENRINRLKTVRDAVAKELHIDSSLVAPRHVLTAVATMQPQSAADLDQVPAMREWQKRLLGEQFVGALQKEKTPSRA